MMRAECVRYYEDKGYPHDHCEAYVPKEESEIRRIYGCIQEEKKRGYFERPNPFPNLPDEETAAE